MECDVAADTAGGTQTVVVSVWAGSSQVPAARMVNSVVKESAPVGHTSMQPDRTGADTYDFTGLSVRQGLREGTWADVKSTEYCLQYVFREGQGCGQASKPRPVILWDHVPPYRAVATKTG